MAKSKTDSVQDDVITLDIQPFLTPISILVGSIIISISILVGLNGVKSGDSTDTKNTDTVAGAEDTTVPAEQEGFAEATTSIDDDPYLGNKDTATVAIVEFSDYECPFCKRHVQETAPQIIENFVNSGQAIYVYRDFPLSFHDPLATKEAIAAECVQDLAGNDKYFQYHDLIFDTTNSNGQGLEESKLYDFASEVGVDSGQFKSCYESEKFADEVANDIAAGQEAGVSGTPGFVIGTLNEDGTVTGKRIDGAYPYADFESLINEYL